MSFLLSPQNWNNEYIQQQIINSTNQTASSPTDEMTGQQFFKLMILLLIALIPMMLCFCACKLDDVLQKYRTLFHRLIEEP